MAVTTTTIAYALKRLYPQRQIENLVYKNNPLLALMPKQGGFGGSAMAVAARYGDNIGRSPVLSTAQGYSDNNKGVQFLVTRVKDYQTYTMETEAILAGKTDPESFVRTLETEASSAMNNIGRSQAIQMYRDGVGELGQLGAVSGTTFTFSNIADITNIEKGLTIVGSTGSTKTTALRGGTGQTVTSVNRSAGSFVVSANTDSLAAGDWIFIKGDRDPLIITAMTQWLRLAGLDAWNPGTAPSASESYFGVDRSVDDTRLAGQRIDISTYAPEEGLTIAANRLAREGGDPSHCFMNYTDSQNLQLALGGKVVTDYTTVGDVGFRSIRFIGPTGDIMVMADQNCPQGVGRLLTLDTWKLCYLGNQVFNLLDMDGAPLSREATADRFEGRIAFYGNMICTAPGRNARMVMPT